MTVYWSDTVRNSVLNGWESAIGTGARLRIYSGALPADESAALAGNTMLWEKVMNSDWAQNAATGTKILADLPLSGAAVAAGTASFYRIYDSAGTTSHEQGSITATGGGGDMTIDNTSIANGQIVNVTTFSKTAPG